ncbi:hypothetical protein [Prosthecochloris sp.]|uniref:hypothetical protein n=1 Tax=Prosthecochloris sp. TaxID=290513 RepID=UPI0025D51481|nr:hypothetical protein [Prosthecochloris sp.]
MKPEVKDGCTRKQLMKTGLQIVFAIAWFPILWLFLSVTLGKLFALFIGIVWLEHSLVIGLSLLLTFFAFRYLVLLSEKIFGDN